MTQKNNAKFDTLASDESINITIDALSKNGFSPVLVENKDEALKKIKELIPDNVSVMNGTSATLKEIGYIDYLKGNEYNWDNLHAKILGEKDPEKQSQLRKLSVISDFYLGSAHSLTENGEIVIASNTGSQMPHLVYTSKNIILVVGAQKITKNLNEALERIEEHVVPLENERMQNLHGINTTHAKTLILHKENPRMGRKIHVIIVKEKLGF